MIIYGRANRTERSHSRKSVTVKVDETILEESPSGIMVVEPEDVSVQSILNV